MPTQNVNNDLRNYLEAEKMLLIQKIDGDYVYHGDHNSLKGFQGKRYTYGDTKALHVLNQYDGAHTLLYVLHGGSSKDMKQVRRHLHYNLGVSCDNLAKADDIRAKKDAKIAKQKNEEAYALKLELDKKALDPSFDVQVGRNMYQAANGQYVYASPDFKPRILRDTPERAEYWATQAYYDRNDEILRVNWGIRD